MKTETETAFQGVSLLLFFLHGERYVCVFCDLCLFFVFSLLFSLEFVGLLVSSYSKRLVKFVQVKLSPAG